MGQYDGLFYRFPAEETRRGDMLPPLQACFRGENSVPGSQICLPYRAYMKPGVIDGEPHFHRDDEYLAFVGHDLRNAFDSFDAEIVFYMGESLDDMEKIVIDKPSMIKVPGLFWHGPMEITRLGKPLFFQPVLFNSRYYRILRRTDKSVQPYMETVCEGISPCRLDKDAACRFCGACVGGKEA